jgi:hypothetical protein
MEPYHDCCGHCDVLYRWVLEPMGCSYEFDGSGVDKARCAIIIRRLPHGEHRPS